MTLAAIYARFSSDSQRDESIEIQVERCSQLIEREKWVLGEIYTDYAMTGTNDERPAFRRCIADGLAGAYDVLVIYKHDRFARNVEISRKYKRMLRDSGVRIMSVREGESTDSPEGFFHEGMDELFAEYYSRNLSVLIREGNRKSAEKRKACGHRVFGYAVDEDDRFVIDEDTAPIVRHLFESYHAGQSVNELAEWMREQGVKTKFGNWWRPTSIARLLKNDAYMGVYRFNGVVDYEDGMPAIVDSGLFLAVQDLMEERKKGKRRSVVSDYLLSGKLYCLLDGKPMSGYSGTSKNKRKYTYYKCKAGGGCGLQIPQGDLEDAVIGTVKQFLSDEAAVNEMICSVMDYAESLPDKTAELEAEKTDVLKQRDNLVASIAAGISPKSVKGAIDEAEGRLEELDMLIAREKFNKTNLLDEDTVRDYVHQIIDRIDRDPERLEVVVKTFVDKVYADDEAAVVLFKLGTGQREFELDELRAIRKGEQPYDPRSEGVRLILVWWSRGVLGRTLLYMYGGCPLLVIRHG